MSDDKTMTGGCLCGAIRYSISGTAFAADYCHCSICRKSTGAMAAAWMDFNTEQLTWLCGEPQKYASSKNVYRGFCVKCGSTLTFGDIRYPQYKTLTIASLDDPNLVQPTYHIYTDDQVKWLEINDTCQRFAQQVVKD